MIERGHTLKDQRTYSRAPGVMPQRGAHENGRRLRKKPLQKAVSETEAEANPGNASRLLKEPAERLAGCTKQKAAAQQLSCNLKANSENCSTKDAMPASSPAELGNGDFEPSAPRGPKEPGADFAERTATHLCPSARKSDSKKYFYCTRAAQDGGVRSPNAPTYLRTLRKYNSTSE